MLPNKITGQGDISATVVADSISSVDGKRIITFELEYPRMIHSEFMTHRMFSRNAASSRAIPFEKMQEQLTAAPIHWGVNQAGMQADTEATGTSLFLAKYLWELCRKSAKEYAGMMYEQKIHKQVINRLTEPFQMIKVVCTATEYENFFWLRNHKDAQPEIAELAKLMFKAKEQSVPEKLKPGEWHTPFVKHAHGGFPCGGSSDLFYTIEDETGNIKCLTPELARKVSAARCAAVSYRKVDYTLEKSLQVFERLVGADRKHASSFEHQATPMQFPISDFSEHCIREKGVTHMCITGAVSSGNFQSWIQYRQLIEGHTKYG